MEGKKVQFRQSDTREVTKRPTLIVIAVFTHAMGGDWASEMSKKIQREYGVGQRRALQIPDQVQKLIAISDLDALVDSELLTEEFIPNLSNDLIGKLNDQNKNSIEGRWNALVKERGIYANVGADVLLYDPAKTGIDPGRELQSDDGESITIQEAISTAW